MQSAGKALLVIGIALAVVGIFLMLYDRVPFLGKLPGDIAIKRENFQLFIPITSSILLSVLISLIVWFVSSFRDR